MNLRENIRRILKEEVNSVDVKTIESELTNMLGSSKIKDGDRVEFVRIGQFNSSFDIVVDQLDQKTLNIINKFMSEKGWFPTNISLSGMKGRIYSDHVNDYIGEEDVQIGYEADFAKEVGIPKTKAFHVTPDIFMDKIKVTGLTAKSESKLSNHPERIYMFLSQDKNAPKDMVQTIWNSLSKERQKEIKDYYVLEIDLTKLPNQKLYHDPQTMITFEAIYTNQPIPKSAIKVIDKISTSNIKTNDNVVMSKDEEKRSREEKRKKEEEALKQKKEFDANLSTQTQTSKEFDKLPDDVKYMSIDDLQESIRSILKEETNQGKYTSALEDLTEEFKNEDCVCDIKIEYKPDEEIYLINVILGNGDMDDKFNGINWRERDYRGKLKMKISKEVFEVLPITFFVEFKQTPRCKDYKNLRESENKKSSLLSNIEENGLYEVIVSTGLHINEVEQMVGQLSREVLDRFIIDVLKEHGEFLSEQSQTYVIDLDSWPLDPVPIDHNEYVERIRTTDNELSFTVMFYEEDEYGDLEETNWEIIPSKNLVYDNIYEIAGQLCYYLVRGQI